MLLQFPYVRVGYDGIDNPLFVSDIQAANEAVLAAMQAVCGLSFDAGFAIISGLEYTIDTPNYYTPGVFWFQGNFYFNPFNLVEGTYLAGAYQPALSEGFDDGNPRNIYNKLQAVYSPTGGDGWSPAMVGDMNTYRIGLRGIANNVTTLLAIANALGNSSTKDVGQVAGTVAAGDDPRMPYTAPQLDARFAQNIKVILKGDVNAYTPVGPNDPANKAYVDASGGRRLASGTTIAGDIPTGGTTVNISFGVTLPDTNYILLFNIMSLSGNPVNDATLHYPAQFNPTTVGISLRVQEGVGVAQNISFKWVLFAQ